MVRHTYQHANARAGITLGGVLGTLGIFATFSCIGETRGPPNCLATNEKFVAKTASGFQYPFQAWFVACPQTVKTFIFS